MMSVAPKFAPAVGCFPTASAQRRTFRRLRAARPAKCASNGITQDMLDAQTAKTSLAMGERISNANAELQVALEKERSERQVALEKERSQRQEKLSAFQLALEKERSDRQEKLSALQLALEKERSDRQTELQRQRHISWLLFAALFAGILLSAAPGSIVSKLVQILLVKVLPFK